MAIYGTDEALDEVDADSADTSDLPRNWIELEFLTNQVQWFLGYSDWDQNTAAYNLDIGSIQAGQTLLLAVLNTQENGADPDTPTITNSTVTWVQIATTLFDGTGTQRGRLTVFRAQSPSNAFYDNITIDFAAVSQESIAFQYLTLRYEDRSGSNGSAAVVQSDTQTSSAGGDMTGSLAAFADAKNATIAFVGLTKESTYPLAVYDPIEWDDYTQLAAEGTTGPNYSRLITYFSYGNKVAPFVEGDSHDAAGMVAIEVAKDLVNAEPNVGDIASPLLLGFSEAGASYIADVRGFELRFQS